MSGIRVENLRKSFANFTAVDDVSFNVVEGELAVLLGPSGSGKSTILRIIAGLDKSDGGAIYLTDQEVSRHRVQKRNIGFVFQHYALFKHMNVEQNIAFGMQIRKMPKPVIKQKVAELIELVKLEGYQQHYASQLSGGQRQRVALARALAPEPRILLLDEPFGALDAKVRENLADWLRSLHKQIALTTILVTHDQKEAIEIADKIIIINRGKVEQVGTARDVYEHPQTKFVASFIGQTNVLTAKMNDGQLLLENTIIPTHHHEIQGATDESVVLLVRPEDICIQKAQNSTQDALPGRIEHIHYRGNYYEIDIHTLENNIKSFLGKQDFTTQEWSVGQDIFVQFRDFQFFNAPEGENEIRKKLSQLGYIE